MAWFVGNPILRGIHPHEDGWRRHVQQHFSLKWRGLRHNPIIRYSTWARPACQHWKWDTTATSLRPGRLTDWSNHQGQEQQQHPSVPRASTACGGAHLNVLESWISPPSGPFKSDSTNETYISFREATEFQMSILKNGNVKSFNKHWTDLWEANSKLTRLWDIFSKS